MASTILTDTPEERELNKRKVTARRIKALGFVMVLAIGARFLISDPPKYVKPQHEVTAIKYLPGMLDAMDEQTRAKLTPAQLEKFKEADLNAKNIPIAAGYVSETYAPTGQVEEIKEDIEAYKEELFQYAKRQEMMEKIRIERKKVVDYTKPTLVRFRKGGYIKVAKAEKVKSGLNIYVNKGLKMKISNRFVKRVRDNAAEWSAPIPRGYVKLKPARGITIIVSNKTSKRITIHRDEYYEL